MIENLGLVLSKVEHERYDGVPPNTVLSQIPKPGTLIEERNMVTFVVSGEGGPRNNRFPGNNAQPIEYQSLEYTVPPGRFEREVVILVKNIEGTTEMYRQLDPPGKLVIVRIPVIGETVVEVYLDGTLETIQRMSNQ